MLNKEIFMRRAFSSGKDAAPAAAIIALLSSMRYVRTTVTIEKPDVTTLTTMPTRAACAIAREADVIEVTFVLHRHRALSQQLLPEQRRSADGRRRDNAIKILARKLHCSANFGLL